MMCFYNKIIYNIVRMRPLTSKPYHSTRPLHPMQTKWKTRVATTTQYLKHDQPHTPLRHHKTQQNEQAGSFKKTVDKLFSEQGQHQKALNDDCLCGRHLTNFKISKPSLLHKKTIYQKSFKPRKTTTSLVVFAKEYNRFTGPNLDKDMRTTYSNGYQGIEGDKPQRPRPEDRLSTEGPVQALTSYSIQFPGHKGDNQYVRPTNKHSRGHFAFRSKSTYSKTFTQPKDKRDDYTYIADQLKTGQGWYDLSTTYAQKFSKPNPEYFAKPVKVLQKKQDSLDYSKKFETTYQKQFVGKDVAVCPAKIWLQTKRKSTHSNNKSRFLQNSDFKSMSLNFQAISTSALNQQ